MWYRKKIQGKIKAHSLVRCPRYHMTFKVRVAGLQGGEGVAVKTDCQWQLRVGAFE